MEYYLSPGASTFYPTPIDQTLWRVDSSVNTKLKFLLRNLGRFYNPDEQLDLPIFFVTDEDLGQNLPSKFFTRVEKRYLTADETGTNACSLPDIIRIPDTRHFHYKYQRDDTLFKQLVNPENLLNPNFGLFDYNSDLKESSDWLGIYCGFHSGYRCIFIRVDEIMKEPLLCNSIGIASVVFHELGHALMDSPEHIQTADKLNFRNNLFPHVAILIKYVLDESLANLIAYKCTYGPSPYENNAIEFMEHKQPFPYPLGVKFGKAKSTSPIDLAMEWKNYIVGWYRAKEGREIGNVPEWVRLVSSKQTFTTIDLKDQYKTLFF